MEWICIKSSIKANYSYKLFDYFRKYENDIFVTYYKSNGRFEKDQLISNSDDKFILINGVLLNKSELLEEYGKTDLEGTVLKMHTTIGKEFFKKFRGPFNGLWFDKKKDNFVAFVNQTGDAPIFYFQSINTFVVSNNFNFIVDFLKENHIVYTFNPTAARHIMTLGFVVDGNTFVKEIQKVLPGNYIEVSGKNVVEEIYHRFDNTKVQNISFEEAIEQVNKGFRNSVKRCFDKDLEYGYIHHLADMSGGLDSRMTTWVAKDMGYSNITNINYSKADSSEEICSKAAATYLKNEYIHEQLDDLSFFYDVDEIVNKNYGLATYIGITGGNRMLSNLNFNKFGLEHTGQLGDIVVGTANKLDVHCTPNIKAIVYSDLIDLNEDILHSFINHELFVLYNRGFQGALSTHMIRRNYTEVVSPYIDVEFLQLCLSIPLKYRVNHTLYWKWIEKCYPDVLKVVSTRNRSNTENKLTFKKLVLKIVGKNKRKVINYLKKINLTNLVSDSRSMNPLDWWYEKTPDVRNFVQNYYQTNIVMLEDFGELKENLVTLYSGIRVMDKLLVLTVLSAYKRYFGE